MPPSPPSIPVCGIGASAGGIEALQEFFAALQPDLGLAYVVVVHLAPDRKSELPHILERRTTMPVRQVGDHDKVELAPDTIYVIAPDRKLEITDSSVGASHFERPRGQRNAIDLFLRSLAATHGDGFAVVLSGSGSDGALGAKAIKEGGGLVLVQDPREAAHGDMPQAVIATGVADVILPARDLAVRLGELARSKKRVAPLLRTAETSDRISADDDRALREILEVLRKRTGHDFSRYKRATVLRRLSRRMQLSHHLTLVDYLQHLRAQATEVQALLGDLLISVTTFFRDPDAWSALRTRVVAPLVEQTDGGEQIRAWVPGCATGEEAYSLAMLFHEEFERHRLKPNFIVFASDLDEHALSSAREGVYPHAISADVSDERLARYFRADEQHYRIGSEIRDHVVFAVHSLLRDPPFSRQHLISCRNVLIYLDRDLQEQVMAVFRYACRDQAYLFLGASEMANDDLFRPIDTKHRIFVSTERAEGRPALPEMLASAGPSRIKGGRDQRPNARPAAAELHVAALETASPPSILVDDRWNVLHLSPTSARFLQQAGGVPARRLTDQVRPELRDEVHAVLHRALEDPAPHLSPAVAVAFNGAPHHVVVIAQRHAPGGEGRTLILVTFLDTGEARELPSQDEQPNDEVMRDLRERLRLAEQRIESMRDDHFLTNEDLRAANEELQSLNEEYRSTTEELETSKEELQSINEELQTVNHELKSKLEDVSRAHADLENFIAAADVAMLFLDRELHIKRFTPRLADLFSIRARDIGRPIGELAHAIDYPAFEEDARRVMRGDGTVIERDVRTESGQAFIMRLTAYKSANQHDIEGVVVTFVDVTAIKTVEAELRESERKLEVELDLVRRLHRMTLDVASAPSLSDALNFLLDTAIELHEADLGNVQLLDRSSRTLRIVAHRGFAPLFLKRFAVVDDSDRTGCGRALGSGEMVQIPDVLEDAEYAAYRDIARDAGYRALQSTPLVGRTGEVVGILSVHFRTPHAFSERDRQLGDLLGHAAAESILSRLQQDELTRANQELHTRTAELAASQERLSGQAVELVEQDRHREAFLAALGHELRNPLGAITSSAALLTATDDRQRRALDVLRRQVGHATHLINELLDITRVKHGRLRLERMTVDLHVSVRASVDTHRPQAQAKGLPLDLELPDAAVYVEADPDRLTQILDNLLSNALTYTDAGHIAVAVHGGPEQVRVAIRDTGVGIDADVIKRLFDPFYQNDLVRGQRGLGLGLAVVKSLVEAHGGTVAVHSDGPGTGSEFSFTLPRARATPVSAPAAEPVAPVPRRVLVVDDQEDVADSLAALLETLGQQVEVAYTGSDALTAARRQQPEIAFLDLSMPETDGAELARRLRKVFGREALTLVAVTGLGKEQVVAAGGPFDHHLLKPVSPEALMSLLNGLNTRPAVSDRPRTDGP